MRINPSNIVYGMRWVFMLNNNKKNQKKKRFSGSAYALEVFKRLDFV